MYGLDILDDPEALAEAEARLAWGEDEVEEVEVEVAEVEATMANPEDIVVRAIAPDADETEDDD
jgi:hypothetical protein